jgi:hypothetical protein
VSPPNLPIFREALGWRQAGRAVAMACVVETWGSAPRAPGSRLVVDADGNFSGSVSGGCVEAEVITAALETMQADAPRLLEFGVADETAWRAGLSCGGRVKIYVERIGATQAGILECSPMNVPPGVPACLSRISTRANKDWSVRTKPPIIRCRTSSKRFSLIYRSNQSANGADHRENSSNIALIESMDGNACADQLCRDLRLEIGKGEDEVRLERADLRNIGRGEGRNARLLAPDLRRPNGIT